MSQTKKKLMIIDGNALVHRSFHALPPSMATKSGEVVNAVYGFTAFLMKAIREIRPEYVVLTMDKKGPTFRHKMFPEYKATRVKAPQELYDQIPRVKEVAAAFDIPTFEADGFEADDLIGAIATRVDGEVEKIIVTGDKDTLQLVNDHTKVYSMSRGVTESLLYDEDAVKLKMGIRPDQMVDYKALRGDPSDNIPGVRGIGEKTAVELLTEFGSLDEIYKYLDNRQQTADSSKGADKIKPRIFELLIEHKKEAYLSKELATIKCDLDIDFDLEKARFRTFDQEKVAKIFSELEFRSLLPRLHELIGSEIGQSKAERAQTVEDKFERNRRDFRYTLVDDEKKFKVFIAKLKKAKEFAVDTETSGFDPLTAELLGISFSWEQDIAYFVYFGKTEASKTTKQQNLFETNKKLEIGNWKSGGHPWLAQLKPILEDDKVGKFGHNAKFDIRVLRNNGIEVGGLAFDTMVASYLLNPGTRQHNLDALTFSELNFEKISKDDLLGKGREKVGFADLDPERLSLYSCEDADFTARLAKKLGPKLKAAKLEKLFDGMEMPLVGVLATVEDAGICLDVEVLAAMGKKAGKKISALETKIYGLAGMEFNINSTRQLADVLFGKLNIPADNIGKTKTGLSTAASELDKMKDLHPIIRLLVEYRELVKLKSTYIDALPELVNSKTGRIHTSYNQAVAATGRLSSTDPNLQNIPVRTELGREIRTAFVAEKGWKLLALDYSQIELRLAAHMSGDQKMIAAFKNKADIHTATAAEINQVSPAAVTPEMRREAKAINFGILYGQGPHGLSQTADIPFNRAKEFIEQYFIVYKDIKSFIEKTIEEARRNHEVKTLFGRVRPLPEIESSVVQVRKAAERMAINTPLQGTAADMIKAAMVRVDREIESPDIRMLLTVHDELIFEVKAGKEAEYAKRIKEIMENVIELKVPIVADAKVGDNWGEMEEFTQHVTRNTPQ